MKSTFGVADMLEMGCKAASICVKSRQIAAHRLLRIKSSDVPFVQS